MYSRLVLVPSISLGLKVEKSQTKIFRDILNHLCMNTIITTRRLLVQTEICTGAIINNCVTQSILKRTFRYSGLLLFNKFPRTLKGATSFSNFKNLSFLNNILLDEILYILLAFIFLIYCSFIST